MVWCSGVDRSSFQRWRFRWGHSRRFSHRVVYARYGEKGTLRSIATYEVRNHSAIPTPSCRLHPPHRSEIGPRPPNHVPNTAAGAPTRPYPPWRFPDALSRVPRSGIIPHGVQRGIRDVTRGPYPRDTFPSPPAPPAVSLQRRLQSLTRLIAHTSRMARYRGHSPRNKKRTALEPPSCVRHPEPRRSVHLIQSSTQQLLECKDKALQTGTRRTDYLVPRVLAIAVNSEAQRCVHSTLPVQ